MSVAAGRAALVRRPGSIGRGGLGLLVVLVALLAAALRSSHAEAALHVAVPALAGAACLVAGRCRVLGRSVPWVLVGVAQLFNATGNVAFTGWVAVWRVEELAGGTAQVLFLAATGLQLVAVLLLARPRDPRRLARAVSEGLLVSAVLFTTAWAHGLGERLTAPGVHEWVAALALVELVWDVVAVVVLAGLWSGRMYGVTPQHGEPGRAPAVPLLLTAALTFAVVGDLCFVVADLVGAQVDVSALGVLWLLSSAAAGVSPWWGPLLRSRRATVPLSRVGSPLAVCVLGVLAVVVAGPSGIDRWVVSGSGAVVALVMVLLASAAHDNDRLTRRLADSERHFRTLVTDSRDVLVRLDADGRLSYVSPSVTGLLGHRPDDVTGQLLERYVHDEDAALVERLLSGTTAGRLPGDAVQLRMARAEGGWVWTEAVVRRDADGGAVLGLRDVDERVRLAAELRHRAVTDALTGLPNRWALETQLAAATAAQDAGGPGVGLLYCDLVGFKDVNDASGHAAGDEVLAAAAARLHEAVGERGVIARFGGDEFAVLVIGDADVDDLVHLARDVSASMEAVFHVAGAVHHLSVNVGVALHRPGRPAAELVRNADVAMYRAKASGWGTVEVFADRMHEEVLDRVRVRRQLRSAVAQARPELRFQPQVRLADGAVVAVEALVGWRSPDGQRLATEAVIELAEDSGAIVELGARVLRAATRQAALWRGGGEGLSMSVNLSVRQLAWPGVVEVLAAALADSGLPPSALTLEITESGLVTEGGLAVSTLEQLRGCGVRLAVDDFGTGYSGLDHLRRLTVDELKIDRSFLAAAGREGRATALLQGMVRLGHDLGLHVVGEGVETLAQARLLRRLGCETGQGYAFSAPLTAAQVPDFVRAGAFDLDAAASWDAAGRAGQVPRRGPGPSSSVSAS